MGRSRNYNATQLGKTPAKEPWNCNYGPRIIPWHVQSTVMVPPTRLMQDSITVGGGPIVEEEEEVG